MYGISPVDGIGAGGNLGFFQDGGWLSLYLNGFTIYKVELQQKGELLRDIYFLRITV